VSYRRLYKAGRGAHGKGSSKTGRNGEDIEVLIPLGTLIYDDESGQLLHDCVTEGEIFTAARGGKGGLGNDTLSSAQNRSPQYVLPGQKGQEKRLRLMLKVLADVGLVGRPNAGKSTFLSCVSRAHPKIADYPFTTTEPHLGIVGFDDSYKSMIVADIPGLIEDSHKGKGLGIRFLKHIERTKVLAILVESLSENPKKDAEILLRELAAYSPDLIKKPYCCILTKADLCEKRPPKGLPKGWLWMSAVTGDNVEKVLNKIRAMVEKEADH
jgi:GTP-binding protein